MPTLTYRHSIHTCTHPTQIYTGKCILYTHACSHRYMHMHSHTPQPSYMHSHGYMHSYEHIYTYIHSLCTHIYLQCTYAFSHAHRYSHAHTHMHAHSTHAWTCIFTVHTNLHTCNMHTHIQSTALISCDCRLCGRWWLCCHAWATFTVRVGLNSAGTRRGRWRTVGAPTAATRLEHTVPALGSRPEPDD